MPNIIKGQTLSKEWTVGAPNLSSSTYTFKLETTLKGQDINNNTSNITVALYIKASFNEQAWYGNVTCSLYRAANGSGYTRIASSNLSDYYGHTYYTKIVENTFNLGHNADGTCSYSVEGAHVRGNNGYMPYNSSGEITSITLPTIPRAASLSVTPTVINRGTNMTVKVTPPNSTFTTTTTYKVGSNTITLASKVTGNRTYTVPYATLASYIGSYTSGVVTVTCQTYNGSTLIGTTSAQVTVQTGVIPMSWVDDRNGHVGVTVGQKASASDYDFRVYLDSKFTIGDNAIHEALRDYVIEQGSSGNWTYRKWASGASECWGKFSKSAKGEAWKSHITFEYGQFTYPSGLFVAAPMVVTNAISNWWMTFMVTNDNDTPATKDTTPSVTGIRPGTGEIGTRITAEIDIYAKGRWK